MNRIIKFSGTVLMLCMLFFSPAFSNPPDDGLPEQANGGNSGPHRQDGRGDNEQGVPIDGGASFLAAAGAAYGMKKYRDYRKNMKGPLTEN